MLLCLMLSVSLPNSEQNNLRVKNLKKKKNEENLNCENGVILDFYGFLSQNFKMVHGRKRYTRKGLYDLCWAKNINT